MNTVYGAVFDHKAETPGLGAEINRDFFEKPFNGKEYLIFKEISFQLLLLKVVQKRMIIMELMVFREEP